LESRQKEKDKDNWRVEEEVEIEQLQALFPMFSAELNI
jgi:hypothetical protein